jgi:transitional endoplasmic reticulum ATPase
MPIVLFTHTQKLLDSLEIAQRHFDYALQVCKPASMRDVVGTPKVHWEDVGGNAGVKRALRETVEHPLLYPHLFRKFGLAPSSGILLYGVSQSWFCLPLRLSCWADAMA